MDAEIMAEIGRKMERLEDLVADLRAENKLLREALIEIATDPRDDSVCIGDGWTFYSDVVNYARQVLEALKWRKR